MLVLEKGIDFEIDENDGSIKMVEKKEADNKYCLASNDATNRFGVYAAPQFLEEQFHLTPSNFVAPKLLIQSFKILQYLS